jgi:flagellar biosynthesis chaperone FliJ
MEEKDLSQLKKDVDEAKQKVSELKGERQALLKMLKDDWGCASVKNAEIKLQSMVQQYDDLSKEIDKELDMLAQALNDEK